MKRKRNTRNSYIRACNLNEGRGGGGGCWLKSRRNFFSLYEIRSVIPHRDHLALFLKKEELTRLHAVGRTTLLFRTPRSNLPSILQQGYYFHLGVSFFYLPITTMMMTSTFTTLSYLHLLRPTYQQGRTARSETDSTRSHSL